jgi:hypothetical protein
MSILPAYWREVHPARRRTLVWPREHGAWGILLVPLIAGAASGLASAQNVPRLLWLSVAVMAAFCLRTPIENSLPASPYRPRGPAEWHWVMVAASAYSLSGAFALAMLLREGALSLVWKPGLAAAGFFALQAAVKRTGRAGRLPAEVIGAFGLTLTAVAAWAVAAGQIERRALALWLLAGLFATDQIVYVQLRIREAREAQPASHSRTKWLFLAGEAFTALLLVIGARVRFIPALAILVFMPVFARGAAWSVRAHQEPLRIHRLGKTELIHSILFGLLLIASFRLTH